MFSNVAIDVVIGLVFIYLLYSLFATVLSEIIATWLGLRARNLKEAVNRMLNNEEVEGLGYSLMDSLKLMKSPDNPVINNFYAHPEIKQLGSSGIFKNPSSFKAESFSKTLLFLLNPTGPVTSERIDAKLRRAEKNNNLSDESCKYVLSLWENSYGDITKFKIHLEAWFDRSMEQATEWYKRKIQTVLLILGFFLAWCFNADTFTIVEKLSKDKDARAQLVQMATAYVEKHAAEPKFSETGEQSKTDATMDSLLVVKKQLERDISDANSILGLGAWPADSISVSIDSLTKQKQYNPAIDLMALTAKKLRSTEKTIYFETPEKWAYFFRLLRAHFFGYLITAIAVSLGAPFWFDLLNKLIKLRTSEKQSTNSTLGSDISPLYREA
jgi:hypothetical protein